MYLTNADIEFFSYINCNMRIKSLLLFSFSLVLKDSHYEDYVTLVGIPDQLFISPILLSSLYLVKSILLIFSVGHLKPPVGSIETYPIHKVY